MSNTGIIILFIVGLLAVFAEILIPGMIVGICGTICVAASIYFAYQAGENTLGNILLVTSILSIPLFVISWYRMTSRTFAITASEEGFTAAKGFEDLLGKEGVAVTPLRPSGIAQINGRRVDVLSSGEMIPSTTRIKVIEVKGNKVVVKPI
ncbi:MAG TPA: NfeD family protein [Candidatus Hypogeohydataceae bacterium YC41]